MPSTKLEGRFRRKNRIRKTMTGTSERPRLCVHRSLQHISAQIVDDIAGNTLVAASSTEKDFKAMKGRSTKVGAKRIGEVLAERAKAKGIESVVFDRSGYKYHGCVKELANGAREKGLRF